MPEGKAFSFWVCVNGSKLPEYVINGESIMEVNLHGARSYIMEEDQQVTANPLGEHAGVIRVELYSAGQAEEIVSINKYGTCTGAEDPNADSKLHCLTKRDVFKHKKDALGTIVSREGRTTMTVVPTGQFVRRYFPYELIEELVLRYRPLVPSTAPPTVETPAVIKIEPESRGDHPMQSDNKNGDLPPANGSIGESSALAKVPPEENRGALISPVKIEKHDSYASTTPNRPTRGFPCASCQKVCRSRIGLFSHQRACQQELEEPVINNSRTSNISPKQKFFQFNEGSMNGAEKEETQRWTKGLAVVDASDNDDSEICINAVEDDSGVYMGKEEQEGDGVIFMRDDDCYIIEKEPEEHIVIHVE